MATPIFAASPVFGPEVAVSLPAPVAADRVNPSYVAAASNGSMALVVWSEPRQWQGNDIFAARVDAAGEPLDPYSIRVSATSAPTAEHPRAVWNGGEFVVFWDARDGFSDRPTVRMRRVGVDGSLRGEEVTLGRGFLDDAAISFGVTALAVRANTSDTALSVWLLDGAKKIAEVALAGSGQGTRLTATASGFAAAYVAFAASQAEFRVTRFSPWGAVEQRDLFAGSTRAFDWRQFDLTARGDDVYLAVVTERVSLLQLPRGGTPLLVATIPMRGAVFDLQWTGDGFAAAIDSIDGAMLWLLAPDGRPRLSNRLTTPWAAALAVIGGEAYAVTATSPFAGPVNVFGQLANEPRTLLSRAAAPQGAPVIASDGNRLLIAWYESTRVMGVFAERDGHPLGAPFEIFPTLQGAHGLGAIFAAGEWLVLRHEPGEAIFYHNLVATHLAADGTPRGDRLLVSNSASFSGGISLATDGTNVLIVFSGTGQPNVGRTRLLTPAGLAAETYDVLNDGASVAWNGALYAIAVPASISVVRASQDGKILTRQVLPDMFGNGSAIATDGSRFLLPFVRIGLGEDDLLAIPLDRDARPAGPPTLIEPANANSPVASDHSVVIAWNGAAYDLAWSARPAIIGHRVARDGRSTGRFQLPDAIAPALFGRGGGTSILAYARPVPELGGSMRVFTRVLSPGAPSRP